jgi:hypothetical protein
MLELHKLAIATAAVKVSNSNSNMKFYNGSPFSSIPPSFSMFSSALLVLVPIPP